MNKFNFRKLLVLALLPLLFLTNCSDDDEVAPPDDDDEVEVITLAVFTFTPTSGSGSPVVLTFADPLGTGVGTTSAVVGDFSAGVEYELNIVLTNELADEPEERDISGEIREEDDEHQFFFQWDDALFDDPMGNGNIGATEAGDPVNYDPADNDGNGRPLGLTGTTWTAGAAGASGDFRIRLQHQPPVNDVDVKTDTSTSEDGDTDFDLEFPVEVI